MLNARSLLFRAFLLDGFGLLFILSLITWTPSTFGYVDVYFTLTGRGLVVIHSFSLPITWLVVWQLYGFTLAKTAFVCVSSVCYHNKLLCFCHCTCSLEVEPISTG